MKCSVADPEAKIINMSHAQALHPGDCLEDYEIRRVLGVGGFGITYLALDRQLDGPVAIKEYFPHDLAARTASREVVLLSPERQEVFSWGLVRFRDEARSIHSLRHQNVVRAHRYIEAFGTAYIVMEYVDGSSLTNILNERGGKLGVHVWRRWLDLLLSALAHVHNNGYLHRDVTPTNILIRASDNEPVLIDFGAARASARERTYTQVLTPTYAPIEQFAMHEKQEASADIYALAAVSYQVLTGEVPPSAPDRATNDRYAGLAQRGIAPQAWLKAIDWALALRPADRPQTVEEWRSALYPEDGSALRAAGAARLRDAVSYGDALALRRLIEAAHQGSVPAQIVLGSVYEHGDGMPEDPSAAAFWYRKGAHQRSPDGQHCLGRLYEIGYGVPHNDVLAAAWYRKAANQGHAKAQYLLGKAYQYGRGVPKDTPRSVKWLRRAAQQGDIEAQQALDDGR